MNAVKVEMFRQLHKHIQPLLDAGWALTGTGEDESWEFGDSVFYDLRRGDLALNVEYYDHGQIVIYPLEPDDSTDDGEPTPAIFSEDQATTENLRIRFDENGWTGPW